MEEINLPQALENLHQQFKTSKEIECFGSVIEEISLAYVNKYGIKLQWRKDPTNDKIFLSEMQMVVNRRKSHFDVYIGRGKNCKWGNPFKESDFSMYADPRGACIEKYRQWILTQPEMLASLPELKGKILGCWCYPKPCHGNVLFDLVQKYVIQRKPLPFNSENYAKCLQRFNDAMDKSIKDIKNIPYELIRYK